VKNISDRSDKGKDQGTFVRKQTAYVAKSGVLVLGDFDGDLGGSPLRELFAELGFRFNALLVLFGVRLSS
jgi:hypothetical protein